MHTLYTVSLGTQTPPNQVNQTASPSFSCHTSDHPQSLTSSSLRLSHTVTTQPPGPTFPLSRTASQCLFCFTQPLTASFSQQSPHSPQPISLSLAPFPSGFILSHSLSLHLSHSSHHTAPNPYLSLSHRFPVDLYFHISCLCIFLTAVTTQPPTHISLSRTVSQWIYTFTYPVSASFSQQSPHSPQPISLSLAPFPSGFILSHILSLHLSHSSHHTAPNPYLSLSHRFPVDLYFHISCLCIFLTAVTTQPPTHISLSLAPFPSGFILSHILSLHLSHSSHHTAPNLYLSLSLALLPSVFILFHTASLCIFLTVVTTKPPTHTSLSHGFPAFSFSLSR